MSVIMMIIITIIIGIHIIYLFIKYINMPNLGCSSIRFKTFLRLRIFFFFKKQQKIIKNQNLNRFYLDLDII